MTERRPIACLLHTTLPGATLLGALVFAPWFWGCTWPLGIAILNDLLLAATAAWACGMLLRSEKSGLPRVLLLSVLGLLAQGWFLALNAHSACDPVTGLYLPLPGSCSWLPGSVDADSSRADMPRLSGLLGAGVCFAWLGRSGAWRRRIFWTMAVTAGSIVLLGCAQRWTEATDIFWNPDRHLDFFFATYRNVTNAGEYLNLVLPLAGSLLLAEIVKRDAPGRLALGVTIAVLLAMGSLIGGSKLAPGVTLAGAALFVIFQRPVIHAQLSRTNAGSVALTLGVVVLMLVLIVQSVGLGVTADRWHRVMAGPGGEATWTNRLRVDRACALAAPDAGALGFGPGAFRAVFPYYSDFVGGDLRGVWTYAHDDYAQTLVEWGWLGAGLWSAYFFGGGIMLARQSCRKKWRTADRIHAGGLLISLVLLALTAAFDFPLQIASIQLYAAAVIGLAWSSSAWPERVNAPASSAEEAGARRKAPGPVFAARISLRR